MPIVMETLNVIFLMFTERSFADTSDIKGPSEISTALEIGYGCTFMRDMTLKLPTLQYFKLLTEKPFDCYFQVRSPFLTGGTMQPENTCYCILKVAYHF